MKQLILATSFFAAMLQGGAQTIEEGNSHLYYERYESAEKIFSQLTKSDPANAETWFGLTKTYMLTDADSMATAALLTAPATLQEQALFAVAKGWTLLAAGNSAASRPLFDRALGQTREKDPVILAAIAHAHTDAKTGNGQYAVDLLNKAIKRDKNNASLYVQLGDAYRKMANGSEAYKAYKNAIEQNGKYAAAYHNIGQIFQSQKNAELYLDYFNKAVVADPAYAPSLYSLYLYQYYHDAAKALVYYNQYMANADHTIQNEYDLTDLLYLTKEYSATIAKAKTLVQKEGGAVQPRLYKLLGYSLAETKDTTQAIAYMLKYFSAAPDSIIIAKDFTAISDLYAGGGNNDSLAGVYLARALPLEKDSITLYRYYKKLGDMAAAKKDFATQATWLGSYYTGNEKATNVDLFNWGIAHYRAENYLAADSVFGIYAATHPEQSFGYYWQAKSKALQDSAMQNGTAIGTYQTLIDVLQKDTTETNYKKWLTEAYNYLAAYEVNTEKDYAEGISYFEKVLQVDPANADAKKYITMLEKNVAEKGIDK